MLRKKKVKDIVEDITVIEDIPIEEVTITNQLTRSGVVEHGIFGDTLWEIEIEETTRVPNFTYMCQNYLKVRL